MKKPIAIISNDWHIKRENRTELLDLIKQKCELANKLNVKYLICLGDVLDSRIAQREEILTTFSEIIDIVEESNLKLVVIPGNHDKTDYSSVNSFLKPYKGRKELMLIEIYGSVPFKEEGIELNFIPYFEEEIWLSKFNEFIDYLNFKGDNIKHILCTHIAITGSVNNDGKSVSSKISQKLFKDFFKVFSGHYHNQQKIGSNFYHLPSIQQNNFGEDRDKGFTVLYNDGSHELIKSKFKEFFKLKIDLNTVSNDDLSVLKREYKNNNGNIRFEFIGSETQLKSLDKDEFNRLGIDVKTKLKEIIDDISYSESTEVVEHTKDSIVEAFKEFCEKEELNLEQGIIYLKKKLK